MSKFKRGNKTPIQISSGHQVRSGADPDSLPRDVTLLAVIPDHPPTLTTDLEKQTWATTCAALIERDLLSTTDLFVVEAYCASHARYLDARRILSKSSHLIKDETTGSLKVNPLQMVVASALQQSMRLAKEMGLTPRARLEVSALKLKNKNLENALSSDHVATELSIIGSF